MDALDLMLGRASAVKLTDPAPGAADLDAMFASAVRAPDHGRLRPWHFVVVPPERRARFGDLLAGSLLRRDPAAGEDALRRERDKAMRAPLIVVVAARLQRAHKIPVIEQLASAAAAAQNIMLTAHALGYGAMWKTGAPAYDAEVKRALGIDADDELVGFLYLGTPVAGDFPRPPRPAPQEFVAVWEG